ncbi:hypothetical protein BWO91_14255 [Plantibacter flavus]|nr:hypothetical protein BWO91_14255 [Plantibacter flavus]
MICVTVFLLVSRPLLTQIATDISRTSTLEVGLQSRAAVVFGWLILFLLPVIVAVRVFRRARVDLSEHRKVRWGSTFWFRIVAGCLAGSLSWLFAITSGFALA